MNINTFQIVLSCHYNLQIDLPGVIVVTEVFLDIRSNSIVHSDNTITVDVGDKLVDKYTLCNKIDKELGWFSKRPLNISCTTTPFGRNVRVNFLMNRGVCDYHDALFLYEVIINGYEKNKYNIWSNWNQWGSCSKSCGSGIRFRKQTCTNTTSLKCSLPTSKTRRALTYQEGVSCNIKPCFQAVYQWTIGAVSAIFILTVFGIAFWYRKFKMITYFDGLKPNPNFIMDPNRTLLEQIEELPYDLHWEFPRNDVRFGSVLGEGNFGRVWLAKAKGIKVSTKNINSVLAILFFSQEKMIVVKTR